MNLKEIYHIDTETPLAQPELFGGDVTFTGTNFSNNLVGVTPTAHTLGSCVSAISNISTGQAYVGGTSITGGILPTTTTITTPPYIPNTGVTPAPYIYPNAWTWPGASAQPLNNAFEVRTETDDNGKDTLILMLGDKKNCNYKLQLLPGIFLYSNHRRPGFIQRMVFRILFGFKWESTLAERFINAL